ncbi:uncharacterized protein PG998_009884 [Apiospora kogelbergensis]|uniref:Uncharacterized protein n=1 Tax=Apiospora kogelbergensis TaxID=1337665 RepID=A0AAW0R966_9PEZI
MDTGSDPKSSATPNGHDRGTSESAVAESPSWARPAAAIPRVPGVIIAIPKLSHSCRGSSPFAVETI